MKTILLGDRLGKKTLSLSTAVYESIKESILSTLSKTTEISFMELLRHMEDECVQFEGDRNWCVLVVKRDLEARGIIKVKISTGRSRGQVISLNKKKSRLSETKVANWNKN
jgi:hypothetical protein